MDAKLIEQIVMGSPFVIGVTLFILLGVSEFRNYRQAKKLNEELLRMDDGFLCRDLTARVKLLGYDIDGHYAVRDKDDKVTFVAYKTIDNVKTPVKIEFKKHDTARR